MRVRWKVLVPVCLAVGLLPHSPSQPSVAAAHVTVEQSPIRWSAVRRLVHGPLPGAQSFTITGERYRFQGRMYFTLAVSIDRPGEPPGGGGGSSFNPSQIPGTFAYSELAMCGRHPYSIVFGLLRAPADVAVARRGDRRIFLRHLAIPAALRVHGVLAYAELAGPPSEVIVRRPDGKRVLDNTLRGGVCP